MDHNKSRKDRETVVDIESSESDCEEERRNVRNKRAKTLLRNLGENLNFEGSSQGECSSNSFKNPVKSIDCEYEDIESLTYAKFGGNGEHTPLINKIEPKDKSKNSKPKKAPKPPRPRKGPSLDTADLQLVKEIAEQTMKRRARADRLKAIKKRRAAMSSLSSSSSSPPPPPPPPSSSSSNSSLFALGVTVLFFLIIIFQGFGSGQSSTLTFNDSPKSSGAPSNGLISIQLGNDILERNRVQQIANPPKKFSRRKVFNTKSSFVERKSGSKPRTSVK